MTTKYLTGEQYRDDEWDDVVDAEYRFIEDEPQQPMEEKPDMERLRRMREAERFEEMLARERREVARDRLQAKREQARKTAIEREKAEFELAKKKREEAAKTAGRVAKAFAPAGAPGGVARFYLGGKDSPMRRATEPRLGALREEGRPKISERRIREASVPPTRREAPLQYGFLRDVMAPKGLSQVEQAALREIADNNDVDTMRHIEDELSQMGYSRQAVSRAVRSLESKGVVVKAGKPAVYELALATHESGPPPIFRAARGY